MGMIRPEDYQYARKNILAGHFDELVARKVIAPDPNVPKGAQEAKRYMFDIPEEGAQIVAKGETSPKITTTQKPTTVPIHQIKLGTRFDEWDVDSARLSGQYALDSHLAQTLGRKIAEKEDSYILKGDSDVDVDGLYGSAGNTKACANKWDAAGGDPYGDMNKAVGELEADGFDCKWVIFSKFDMKLLRERDAYGNVYLNQIKETLGLSDNQILKTATLDKGTALLGDAGADIAELKIAEDITVLPIEKREDIYTLNAREKIGIDIYFTDAFCTMTNIS